MSQAPCLAWVYLRESNLDAAVERLTGSIARFAHHHGAGHLYHETLTQAWARIVALAIAETPSAGAFDELLAARPHLLDKSLPLKHYSSCVLWSGAGAMGRT